MGEAPQHHAHQVVETSLASFDSSPSSFDRQYSNVSNESSVHDMKDNSEAGHDDHHVVYTVSPTVKAVAGSIGGIVEACLLQPVDVVKTRLQLDKTGHYNGMIHCGKTVAHEEGVKALWKGLTPFVGQLTLKYALRMGSNAFFLELMRGEDGTLTTGARLSAGLGAGVSEALLVVTPFEVIKTRLQQQRGSNKALMKYRGPVHAALTIAREEGVMSLWKGATATTIRQGSNQMSLFWGKSVFDSMVWGKNDGDGKVLSPVQSAVSGFAAACIGPLLNNPFDVVKVRLIIVVFFSPILVAR